ncbi:MAG: hypothetical protein Q8K70_11000 [Bacteroidota bacterium]|nr:hypothetical protein [Bacteroidota bacterium]
MNKIFLFSSYSFVLFVLFLFSCTDLSKVDVSDVKVDLKILRFENDLFDNKLNTLDAFKSKYGAFVNDYNMGIMGFEGNEQEAFNQLMMFKNDPNAKKQYQLVNQKYQNFEPYEKELTQAYQYFKYYFPKEEIPKIITFISNFSFYMNPVGEDYIGVSLDMHMGEDFKPYLYTNIENYWRKILTPKTITLHHLLAHANDLFYKSNLQKNFLDEMVYQGKLLYFIDRTIPELENHIKIGMTKEEYEWCLKEEANIWSFFVKEKIIYETDSRKYDRFFKEGPKTIASGVPEDAPPMLGKFLGWQLVRKYMDMQSKTTLPELMNNSNSSIILRESQYKPQ